MNNIIRKTVAANIKRYRKEANLTQSALAEKIDRTVEMVSQLENNVSSTKLVTLEKIAEVLGIEPYRFLMTHDYPEYSSLPPELIEIIALLQKQPKEMMEHFLQIIRRLEKEK